jgi:catechol 2,3-dioxygenase-like lactoylglutathione lyase family enzyme
VGYLTNRTTHVAVIRYLVSDVDVAVEFYINILGFELVEK